MGYAQIAGDTTTDVRLRVKFSAGAFASGEDSVRIIVNGKPMASLTLRALQQGFSFRPFTDNDTSTIGVLLVTRRTGARGGGELLLETDAPLMQSSLLVGMRKTMRTPNVSLSVAGNGCPLEQPTGACGTSNWQITPFVLDPDGRGFKSGFGTGASGTIQMTFSQPISSITVTAVDPTFLGNKMTAEGPTDAQTINFEYSNQPGLLILSTRTLIGEFTTVRLEPAPGDYVVYSASITVGSETFDVKCEPATVTRGSIVTCSAELSPANTFTLTRRQIVTNKLFPSNKKYQFSENPLGAVVTPSGPNNTAKYEWKGEAAEYTEVTFRASRTNAVGKAITYSGSASFNVVPRTWSPISVNAPIIDTTRLYQTPLHTMLERPVANGASGGTLGLSGIEYEIQLKDAGEVAIDSGPNKGLGLIMHQLAAFDHGIWMHPGLYNLSPSQAWYAEQDSTKGNVPVTIGTSTQTVRRCGPRQFRAYAKMLERHEGVTQDLTRSHWGIYASDIMATQLHSRLESIVVKLSTARRSDEVYQRALKYLDEQLKTSQNPISIHAKQVTFDQNDYDAIKRDILAQETCFPYFYP